MADYPNHVPIFPVYGRNLYPKSADRNTANREIEAICTELGIDPKSIDDTVAPVLVPSSVAAYLDMLANILKVYSGAGANEWYSAAYPTRKMIGGNGGGAQVGAGATQYVAFNQALVSSTENLTSCIITYHGLVKNIVIRLAATANQPATGTLVFTLRVNGVDSALVLSVPANSGSAAYTATGSIEVFPGNILTVKVVNNAAGNSADIRIFSMEVDQKG